MYRLLHERSQAQLSSNFISQDGYVLTSSYPSSQFPYSNQAPSNGFQTCQNCSTLYPATNGRCNSCNTYTTSSNTCDSCYDYVNALAISSTSSCVLCNNATFNNCLQCNNSHPAQCLSCDLGYYLENNKVCAQCLAEGCLRCSSSSQCLECDSGYVYNSTFKNCTLCQLSSQNQFLYEIQDYRCTTCLNQTNKLIHNSSLIFNLIGSQANNTQVCGYCDLGFQNSTFDPTLPITSCQLKCGDGQYPVVTFQTVNQNQDIINSTNCSACPSNCTKCIGSDPSTQCTECPAGSYLMITDSIRRSGYCQTKLTANTTISYDLYVSNLATDYATNPSLRNGSLTYPFVDITDAFTRAKELACQYTNTVTVNIYLYSGTHYLLRDRGDGSQIYYASQFYDPFNLNYEVFVNPIGCNPSAACNASQITLLNKRREALVFDVAVMLYMRNIIIDSLDSILPSNTSCLAERRQCCQIQGTTISNVNSSDTFSCNSSFIDLNLDLACYINQPRTMFRMRLNDQSQITSPNQLILENAVIENIFYDMNSVVNLTKYGGNVQFLSTKFQRISICGAIVKNYYANFPLADFSYLNSSSGLTVAQINFMEKLRTVQQRYVDLYYNSYFREPASSPFTSCTQCFSLTIKGCNFTQLPFNMNPMSSLNLVSASNGLRYEGSVFNLVNFQGDIIIQDSSFSDNKFNYDGCENILSVLSANPSAQSSIDNLNQLYNPSTSYNLYQIKSIITILEHAYNLLIMKNTFSNNVAFKGIINIELSQNKTAPAIIYGNNFTGNSAILEANVLNVRVINDVNLLGYSYTSSTDLSCGGISFNSNVFINNYGCSQTNGAVFAYCFDNTQSQPSSIIEYVQSYDSQYFIGSSGNLTLITGSDVSTLPTTAFTYTYTPYSYNSSTASTPASISITTNIEWFNSQSNTFTSNFAGGSQQIIDIQGFPVVFVNEDAYDYNQNYFPNTFRQISQIFQQQTNQSIPVALTTINSTFLAAYSFKANAVIRTIRCLSMQVTGTQFNQNFIEDYDTPSGTERAQALLLSDLYGFLSIDGGSIFSNNSGIRGVPNINVLCDSTVSQGFSTRIINQIRTIYAKIVIQNVTFILNQGSYDATLSGISYPYLFKIDQITLFNGTSLIFNEISVLNNTFYNGFGMLYFDVQTLAITNSLFTYNGLNGVQTNCGLLIILTGDNYSISIQNNIFNYLYTNNYGTIYFQASTSNAQEVVIDATLTQNSFSNIFVNSTGSSVLTLAGLSQSFTSQYLINLLINYCTFLNITSASDSSIILVQSQTITASSISFALTLENSIIAQVLQGSVIQLQAFSLAATTSADVSVLMQNLSVSFVEDGYGLLIGNQDIASQGMIGFQVNSQESTFSNFANGTAIQSGQFAFTAANAITSGFQITSSTFDFISNGSAINFAGGSSFTGSTISMTLTLQTSSLTNIADDGIYLGSLALNSSGNITLDYTLDESNFTNISQRAFEVGQQTITCGGDFQQIVQVSGIGLSQVLKSAVLIDSRAIQASGNISLEADITGTSFQGNNNLYGSIAFLNSTLNSTSGSINNTCFISNCSFSNFLSGNGIYIGTNLYFATQDILDQLTLSSSNFSAFTAGSALLSGSLSGTSYGSFRYIVNVQGLLVSSFNSGPALQLSDLNVESYSTILKSVTVQDSQFEEISSIAASLGAVILSSTGLTTQSYTLSNLKFTSVTVDAIFIGSQAFTSTTGSLQTSLTLSDSAFSSVSSSLTYALVQVAQSSNYTSAIQINNISVIASSSNALAFGTESVIASSGISNSFALTFSNFTNTNTNAIFFDKKNLTSGSSLVFNCSLQDSAFTNVSADAFSLAAQNMQSQGSLSYLLSFQYLNLNIVTGTGINQASLLLDSQSGISQKQTYTAVQMINIGANGIGIGSQTITNSSTFEQQIDFEICNFTNVTQTAIYISSLNVYSTGDQSEALTIKNCNFNQISQYGVIQGQQSIKSDAILNKTILFQSNSFKQITDDAVNIGAINAVSAGNSNFTNEVLYNAQSNCQSNGFSFGQVTITSSTTANYTHFVSQNSLNNITGNGYYADIVSISATGSVNQDIAIDSNALSAIKGDGISIAGLVLNSSESVIAQAISTSNNTLELIGQNAFSLSSIDLSSTISGLSIVSQQTGQSSTTTANQTISISNSTYSNVSQNGIFIGGLTSIINSSLDQVITFTDLTMTNITNTTILISGFITNAVQIDQTLDATSSNISTITSGAGVYIGDRNLNGTSITLSDSFQSLTIADTLGLANGYGVFVGILNLNSTELCNLVQSFQSNSMANLEQSALFGNGIDADCEQGFTQT